MHHHTGMRILVLFVLDVLLVSLSFFLAHLIRFGGMPSSIDSLIYLPLSGLVILLTNFVFFQYDLQSLNFNTGIHYRSFLIFPFNLLIIAAAAFIVGPYEYDGSIWGRGVVFLYAGIYSIGSFFLRRSFHRRLDTDKSLILQSVTEGCDLSLARRRMAGERLLSKGRYAQDFNFKIPIEEIDAKWILNLELEEYKIYNKVARARDVIFSALGLICASPLLVLSCMFIYFEDRKSPIFKQTRRGLYGKPFSIIKLRTMRKCSGEDAGYTFTFQGDCRVTKIGRFLRKTRIDEIPQLFNVLRGEMSLIGPRPEREEVLAELRANFEMVDFRTLISPGVTGWAQVKKGYCSDREALYEKFEFDAYYLMNRSFILDLLIALKTFRTIVWGQGI